MSEARDYVAAGALLALGAEGLYFAGRQAADLAGEPSAYAFAIAPGLCGLVAGAFAHRRLDGGVSTRAARRALAATATGFGAALGAVPELLVPAALTAGITLGPELLLLSRAHRARRERGEVCLYPGGWPRAYVAGAVASVLAVAAALPALGAPLAALFAGVLAALLAVSTVLDDPRPSLEARVRSALGALPALALGVCFLGAGPLLLGAALVPALLIRVRPGAGGAAAAVSCLGAALLLAQAHAPDYVPSGSSPLVHRSLDFGARRFVVSVSRHRDGAYQVHGGGMEHFTDDNDARLAESLVHPAMALARGRAQVLLVGGECSGVPRELAKYSELREVDLLRLHPGLDRFCRSVPAVARALGDYGPQKLRRFRTDEWGPYHQSLTVEPRRYDVILVLGPEPGYAPPELHGSEFYRVLSQLLAPGGVLASRAGGFATEPIAQCAASRIAERFREVVRFHVYTGAAASSDHHLFVVAAQEPLAWDSLAIAAPTRAVTASYLRARRHFPLGVDFARVAEPAHGCASLRPEGS